MGGQCSIICESGMADCDGLPANGCESDLFADAKNCGACGAACDLAQATVECTQGECTIRDCAEGWADCNGDARDGCEVDTLTDLAHCGSCGAVCSQNHAVASCTHGRCNLTCARLFVDCDGAASNGCEISLDELERQCGPCGPSCQPDVQLSCGLPSTSLIRALVFNAYD